MDEKVFEEIGFSPNEAKIYLSILRRGTATVREIAKESGSHRTHIYDTIEKLREKGLVTPYAEGKVTKYKVTDPQNLFNLIDEKKEVLESAFEGIQKLYTSAAEPVEIKLFKGKEGMKAVFNDILRENKPYYAFGITGQMREHLPLYAAQWLKKAKKQGLKYYGIYTRKDDPPVYYTEIRFLPKELKSPVSTYIYGNKVNIAIWEPSMISINIQSEYVAETYRKHFNLLWNIAEKEK